MKTLTCTPDGKSAHIRDRVKAAPGERSHVLAGAKTRHDSPDAVDQQPHRSIIRGSR